MIRWLFSKTIRDAVAMRKHVQRLLHAQRDLLKPEAVGAVQVKIAELNAAVAANENDGKIRIKTEELQFAAEKWIKSYPNHVWRENVEVLLVAIAVAMGIRTFFVQPFKIPTGSMQPTLYGVTSKNLLGDKNFQIPAGFERVKEWFQGISYVHVVAPADGTVDRIGLMQRFLIFNFRQTISIGGIEQTMWLPPDYGESDLEKRAGLEQGKVYHKGDDVVKLEVQAGDHLFVNRLTYNFQPPARGDIVVFETRGIPKERRADPLGRWNIPPDQFYIKRLVGLGGETISLKQDYKVDMPQYGGVEIGIGHLMVNGEPLSASTPHFENVYSFSGITNGTTTLAYHENQYYGHAMLQELAPEQQVQIRSNHLFVMGDNTMNSLDSRYWGDFPANSVIGKSFFVYWPLSKRFGWGND